MNVAEVIARARDDYLLTGQIEARNRLSADIAAGDTTIAFVYDIANDLARGKKISIGLEDMYVWDADTAANRATVERGDFGTTAAAHTTAEMVRVAPKFSDAQLLRAINDELAALSSPTAGLYRMRSVDLTYNAAAFGYDLALNGFIGVWEVRADTPGPANDWPIVEGWRVDLNLPTTDFGSGQALIVHDLVVPGQTIRVSYRASFSPVATLTDDLEATAGLHAEAHDIVAIGAAIRLLSGREARRSQIEHQPDSRRSEEVPAGASIGAVRTLKALYVERLAAERSRLGLRYPGRTR